MVKQASLPLPDDKFTRRSHLSTDGLSVSPVGFGIDTVYDLFPQLAKKYGEQLACGYRDVIKVVEEAKDVKKMVDGKETTEKKTWKYFELSDYKYVSYNEVFKRVQEVASGLQHLGLKEGSRVAVYAETGLNWQVAAHGCTRALLPITTAYPTLGVSGLAHSLTEPEVEAVFTNAALLPTLQTVLSKGTKTGEGAKDDEGGGEQVRFVVYDGETKDQKMLDSIKEVVETRGGKLVSFEELRKIGTEHPGNFDKKPSRDDTFCIMYTSGSSGAPKGVILTHGNIVSSLGGTVKLLGPIIKSDDTFLAFLPLSHILEMLVELTFYTVGTRIGYGSVKTLTDASVRNCAGDLKAFKPSIIVGVPAIFETIRKGIVAKINGASSVAKGVFNFMYTLKKNVPALGAVADAVVFNKVAEATGGRLRIAMNGGASLSKPTQEFLSTAVMTVLQGYGLTETCGMAAILVPEFWNYSTVGVVVPSMEIKLLDYPDAGYVNTNNPPQGEILLRGGSVTKGYFKRPDLDKEAFTEDGFFKTGDVGQWNPDGTLSIIDRIKNLVKLSSGEYIALESLESVYKGTNVLNNLCVYADADCSKPVAVATTHEPNLRHFVKSTGVTGVDADGSSLQDLCDNKNVQSAVLKAVNDIGRKNGLKGPEALGGIILDATEWTPENGMVTAAQKLNRKEIIKTHQKKIDALTKS